MLLPRKSTTLAEGTLKTRSTPMPCIQTTLAVAGIDIGESAFHVVGLDRRGAIVLRQKWSRGQVWERFANACRRASSGRGAASARTI